MGHEAARNLEYLAGGLDQGNKASGAIYAAVFAPPAHKDLAAEQLSCADTHQRLVIRNETPTSDGVLDCTYGPLHLPRNGERPENADKGEHRPAGIAP